MSDNPGYFAIIPASVRYDPELRPNAKLLYGELTALASTGGYCFATNNYFAELYGLKKATISELINQLADRGHIKVELIKTDAGAVDERRIWIAKARDYIPACEGIPKKPHTLKKPEGYAEKTGEGMRKNPNHNNTRVNKTVNNTPIAPKFVLDKFAEFAGEDKALLDALMGFAEMRSKKKKPINTERSASILLNKMDKLSGGDGAVMAELLDEATLKGWSSVYAHGEGSAAPEKKTREDVIPEWT